MIFMRSLCTLNRTQPGIIYTYHDKLEGVLRLVPLHEKNALGHHRNQVALVGKGVPCYSTRNSKGFNLHGKALYLKMEVGSQWS